MQQYRHMADYDSGKDWSRREVSFPLTALETAFRTWKPVSDDDAAQDLLVLLLIKYR